MPYERKKPESNSKQQHTPNYISYNQLSMEDRLFFAQSDFDYLISHSSRLLKNHIKPTDCHNLQLPYLSDDELIFVNESIEDILSLIGDKSNQRFGSTPLKQHEYFLRPSETETFPLHLYIARYNFYEEILGPSSTQKHTIIPINKGLFDKSVFKDNHKYKKIRLGRHKLNETETIAVSALYMIDLVWSQIKSMTQNNELKVPIVIKLITRILFLFNLTEFNQSRLAGGNKGKSKTKFCDTNDIILKTIEDNIDLSSVRILSRIKQELKNRAAIGDLQENEIPSDRKIKNLIRTKKNIAGT
jgi:hypothetical protein